MPKRLQIEGDGFSKIIQIMRETGYNKGETHILGTVTKKPPDLKIKLDNFPFELDKNDLIIAEHLTRHKRIVTIRHLEGAERNLGDRMEKDYCEGDLISDDLVAPYTSFAFNYVEMQYEDVLKEDDRVIVIVNEEDMTFTVYDRAVKYK
ncbi:DUF2577 family protein [Metabacillus fastidiosus]|uniref:DUF2577 family protein n=1 Tax=Metabacillus fastidiosus TaxID=1458 RepID=A0ABU6NTS0_9BACI|nr:DUF2577 family protein [Metabacillus fastidiosus]